MIATDLNYNVNTLVNDEETLITNLAKLENDFEIINLKNIEELERKYLNDENHAEYEALGHSIDKIKDNLKNKTMETYVAVVLGIIFGLTVLACLYREINRIWSMRDSKKALRKDKSKHFKFN